MELILGGYAQGKLDFAKSCYPDAVVFDDINYRELLSSDDSCGSVAGGLSGDAESVGDIGEKCTKIWNHFNISVKKMLELSKNDDEVRELIQKSIVFHKNLVIISDEIGCGIVPMNADDRHFREFIGRIQCFLAEKAERVFRVVCGIPQRIK
ncbi:MAG: bifunctional adenosylcobinamide kinase/adenosylcobinamide-phosphate guanylyltransferase [Treponemataceae bacterium]|nr:bifunctional adenosylcobinamide kinase/adenosylcobinamide-phosphate guanylyltransferase [Treponemataceae bacterium]